MAKKKNELKDWVTRDGDGTIKLWSKMKVEPERIKSSQGEWGYVSGLWIMVRNMDIISKGTFKAFIGNLPRKGTCTEWRKK